MKQHTLSPLRIAGSDQGIGHLAGVLLSSAKSRFGAQITATRLAENRAW